MNNIVTNQVLVATLSCWALAQILKVPLEYLRTKHWNWSLLLRAGGMPSSHSALVAGMAHSTGMFFGYGTPLFALTFVVAMIVVYDATGIRRQAGKHAEIINTMIMDLASGHPLKEEQLREVLGHTPIEALAGTVLGIVVAHIIWLLWL
jgi:acid phosphatase family membrane protein YuiD